MSLRAFDLNSPESFELVFNQYFHRLCSFSYQYVQEAGAVEDLVQDVFVSFWQKRDQFDSEAAMKSFLYTSVKNKCLNHIKHQLVVRKHEPEVVRELENEEDFNRKVIAEDVYGQLYTEVMALPMSAQKIILLVLKGKKNREIAEILDISENTVKTQKKIAYARLKDRIKPQLFSILVCL